MIVSSSLKAFLFAFLDSCFFSGYNIWANDLRFYDGAPTPYHCQFECKKDNGCFFFTYNANIQRCHMKTGALGTKRNEVSYLISGPKTCTRMIGWLSWFIFCFSFKYFNMGFHIFDHS